MIFRMKKHYFFFLFFLFAFYTYSSHAQLIGGSVYLQGQWLEIGICPNGALGANPPPAGYHPHGTTDLAEVYDFGHDGWTVGTPPYMGDYTYPGSPFEGWEV